MTIPHFKSNQDWEANSSPGFKGFEEALGINIPQKVFDYVKLRCGG